MATLNYEKLINEQTNKWVFDFNMFKHHLVSMLVNAGALNRACSFGKELPPDIESLIHETIEYYVKEHILSTTDDDYIIRKYVNLGIDEFYITDNLCALCNMISDLLHEVMGVIDFNQRHYLRFTLYVNSMLGVIYVIGGISGGVLWGTDNRL